MAKRVVWTEQAKADVRGIEQPIAMQILKTLARYALTGEGDTKQLRDIEPPLIRLRAQDQRIFFATRATTCKSPACSIARKPIAEPFRQPHAFQGRPHFPPSINPVSIALC